MLTGHLPICSPVNGEKYMNEEHFFTPHITVACVVQAENKFLIVEEIVNGKTTLNQPAGHVEQDESIVEAMQRELWEETGLNYAPQSLIKIFQWIAPDNTPFIRFTFALDLLKTEATTPHDQDIEKACWLSYDEIIHATNLRSPLVRDSLIAYQQALRYPLSVIESLSYR